MNDDSLRTDGGQAAGTDRELAVADDQAETADAFAAVASDLRLSILRALWETDGTASFSALHDRVGLRDSAQFNYHLKKLVPEFVKKTDDGYHLAWAGRYVVQAIVAGTFTSASLDPFPAGGACVACDGDLVARYQDDVLSIRCGDCDRLHSTWPFPPGALVDRDEDAVLAAYNQWVRHIFDMGVHGVCADCGGTVEKHLWTDFDASIRDCAVFEGEGAAEKHATLERKDGDTMGPRITYECQRCRLRANAYPGMVLLVDPTVQAFYRDHGRDLDSLRYWTLPWTVDDSFVDVVSEDPARVRVTIDVDDEQLAVTLDDTLSIVAAERSALAT